MLTHGMSRTPEYRAWAMMLQRCENTKSPRYHRYGERGIKVCDAWHDFQNFYADMGDSGGLTLDRIDNDGNYEPGNCRWASYATQNSNYSRNRFISFRGETLTLTQWAKRIGIHPTSLHYRLTRFGWPVERALTTTKGES